MKFDVVFSNPPYENIDLKILSNIKDVADEFVIVHPASWVLDKKGINNIFNNFKDLFKGTVKSLEFFNGKLVFGISKSTPCVISHFVMDGSSQVSVDFYGQTFNVDSVYDVSPFGDKWKDLVYPFMTQVKDEALQNGNLHSNWDKKLVVDDSKFYVQFSQIRGNMSKDKSMAFNDDFFTMVMPEFENNKGIRLPTKETPTYEFATEQEQSNFVEYAMTDFARFCLSIYKINPQLARGELEIIPWLDFTEKWDDDKLFQKFNVSKDLQDFIRDFLPDYYGIRK